MNKIGLTRYAYNGVPRPPTKSVPFGLDNHELRSKAPKWNFKTKRLRRAEMIATI